MQISHLQRFAHEGWLPPDGDDFRRVHLPHVDAPDFAHIDPFGDDHQHVAQGQAQHAQDTVNYLLVGRWRHFLQKYQAQMEIS